MNFNFLFFIYFLFCFTKENGKTISSIAETRNKILELLLLMVVINKIKTAIFLYYYKIAEYNDTILLRHPYILENTKARNLKFFKLFLRQIN